MVVDRSTVIALALLYRSTATGCAIVRIRLICCRRPRTDGKSTDCDGLLQTVPEHRSRSFGGWSWPMHLRRHLRRTDLAIKGLLR